MARRQFKGGAAQLTLNGNIAASGVVTINTLGTVTAWPTGGANGKFLIVIDKGNAGEEKLYCSALTGNALTVASDADRGADGTAAASHISGVTINHCGGAIDLDEPNQHIFDTAQDNHSQYLNTARHDITARHAFGSALGTPAAPADIGTAASAGVNGVPARADHVHVGAALGRQASAQTSTPQSVSNTGGDVDLTTLTVTFTFVSGRRYRISGNVEVSVPNSTAIAIKLKQAGTQVAQDTFVNQVASGGSYGATLKPVYIDNALSGSITFKLSAEVSGGSTASTTSANRSFILVEDIGT